MIAIVSVWDRLEEWGRWGRSGDAPHLHPCTDAILGVEWLASPLNLPAYDLYNPYRTAVEEGGEVPPLDPPQDPIDERRAQETDRVICVGIHWRHRKIIQLHFYKLRRQDEDYVGAAVRAVSDVLEPCRIRRVA